MSAPDDQRLVDAARGGDLTAFAALIDAHYRMLLGSCRRMLGDPELAADAAQEAVLRAMLGLDHLRDDARFGAWLIGIGLNVCRGLLAGGRRVVSLDALREHGRLQEPADDGPDPVELIAAGELAARVRDAITALPPGQREAVTLYYLHGLTQAEAGQELRAREGAIKTRLHKARSSLRVSLNDTYEEYIAMPDSTSELVPMHIAGIRMTTSDPDGVERHIMVLEADDGKRRLPIWVGPSEATALALILEGVELPRPMSYQFTASLLAAAGTKLREVRVTELSQSTFYARAILEDGTEVDARPSDALTLALVCGAPIAVAAGVLEHAELDDPGAGIGDLVGTGDARAIADAVMADYRQVMQRLDEGGA